jgi:hypothetical protein
MIFGATIISELSMIRKASHKATTFWLWMFPVAYLMHITEESYGGEGYSGYLERLRGIHLSSTRFLMAHGVGLALMVAGVILARQLKFPNLLSVILGAVLLVNGLTHAVQTLAHREYVPGLVTAVLIWLPLGVATLVRFKDSMSKVRYWLSVAVGVAINVVVELLIISSG